MAKILTEQHKARIEQEIRQERCTECGNTLTAIRVRLAHTAAKSSRRRHQLKAIQKSYDAALRIIQMQRDQIRELQRDK